MIDYPCEIPLPGRLLAPSTRAAASTTKASRLGFVAGEENRLVANTINCFLRPVSSPDTPKLLALCGASGTGKTHLAQGLVHHWHAQRGAKSALYLTAGDFYRQLLDAIKRDTVVEFRRALRDRELLAIDDLQELSDHAYVSQELRYTLDVMAESGSTIVVTSRRPAYTLANLTPDVRSRLAAGLMLQLAAPGNAARVRIIRRASESLGRPVSGETANRVAESLPGTANDLFGAVFELCAAPNIDQLLAARVARQPQLREIFAAVARYFKLPQAQLKSHSRRKSLVTARAIAIYLARKLTGASYEEIGRALGGRDHTTIIHNNRKIERDRFREPIIQEAIEELSRTLQLR